MPFDIFMGDEARSVVEERATTLLAMRKEFDEREEAMRIREADVVAEMEICRETNRWARRLVAFAFGWPVLFEIGGHLLGWLH